jgi:pimeloyl-ACP methyl ester carboxylesterase
LITEHVVRSERHTTSYLAAGPESGPLIVFVHGWPELSLSWRHQLPCFGALGFRAVAPDLRGYGRSTVYTRHEDYALEEVVADMLELVDALGRERAVWVGHDWGSPVVWSVASHHPDRCHAAANLCVPYRTLERGVDACIAQVNRDIYPAEQFPAGQWDYQLYYQESFGTACSAMDSDPYTMVKALFRKGDPEGLGKPAATAFLRAVGGWSALLSGGAALPRDDDVISESDLHTYASALTRNGFFGPDSYYMNHEANAAYAARAPNGGTLHMPVLFLAAQYDYICDCITSSLADPMRAHCSNLREATVYSGHWMAQERPRDVNAELARWLATSVPDAWPELGSR